MNCSLLKYNTRDKVKSPVKLNSCQFDISLQIIGNSREIFAMVFKDVFCNLNTKETLVQTKGSKNNWYPLIFVFNLDSINKHSLWNFTLYRYCITFISLRMKKSPNPHLTVGLQFLLHQLLLVQQSDQKMLWPHFLSFKKC